MTIFEMIVWIIAKTVACMLLVLALLCTIALVISAFTGVLGMDILEDMLEVIPGFAWVIALIGSLGFSTVSELRN